MIKNLFEFDKNMNILPAPEVLMIKEFGAIWDRDKTQFKKKALTEFSYVWYMCVKDRKKNPYYEKYVDDADKKSLAIIADIFTDKWKVDKVIENAISKFNELNYSEAIDTRDSLIIAKTRLKEWFRNFTPEQDDTGNLLQRNTKSIQELTKAIKEYDTLVEQELTEISDIYGGGEIGYFE
jgi:hypothetical protein